MKRIYILLLITVLFSCTQKYPFRIGKDYILDYDGNNHLYLLNNNNTIKVDIDIKELNFDSIYIIAKQKPIDSIMEDIDAKYPGLKWYEQKKLIEKSILYNYWIVNKKKKDYIYGPLSKERYKALKDSLHIGLKLKKPSEL